MTAEERIARVRALLRNPFLAYEDLTDDERRVAILAARDGLTLRQIEDKTGIPWPTVGYHLRQVQRKIGLDARPGKSGSLQSYLIRRIAEIVGGK